MIRAKAAYALLMTSTTMLVAPAWAQSQTGQPPSSASVPPTAQGEDDIGPQEIVVTARKREELLQKVPLAISALTGDTLRESGAANFRDLQALVPSLTLLPATSDRSALQLAIRGQFQSEVLLTVDPSVGIYLDGVAVPRSFGISPSLVDLAQVAVLKGPQGTLYGRNTTGGAITLTTVRPSADKAAGFASAQIANYGSLDLSGAINLPIVTDTMAIRLVARSVTSEGFGRDSARRKLANQDQQYARLRWTWDPTNNLRFDFTGEYTKIDDGGPSSGLLYRKPYPPALVTDRLGNTFLDSIPVGLREIAAENNLPQTPAGLQAASDIWQRYLLSPGRPNASFFDSGTDFPQYIRTKIYSASLTAELDLTDRLSVKSVTGYRHIDRNTAVDSDATPFTILHVTFPTQSKFFSQELNVNYETDRFKGVIGGYYSHETGFDGTISIIAPLLNPFSPQVNRADIKNVSGAIFAQATYTLFDGLNVTAGVRGTKEEKGIVVNFTQAGSCLIPVELRTAPAVCLSDRSSKYEKISYLASIDYSVARDIMFYLKTSRGFRGGGQNLRGTSLISSQPFAPEVATDYEVGLKAQFLDRRLRLNIAGYRTLYRDIQRSVALSDANGTTVTVVTNAAKAHINGLEVEATAYPMRNLMLSGTFAYTDARYDNFVDFTGDRTKELFPIPKKTFSLSARYEQPTSFGSIVARADYNWQDTLVLVPRAFVPSTFTQRPYGLLNGRLEIDFKDAGVSFAVFGRNLTNKHYYVSGVDFDQPRTGLGGNTGYKGDPRTYGFELRKIF